MKNYWNTYIKRKHCSHELYRQTHHPVKDNLAVPDSKMAPSQLSTSVIVSPQNYAVEPGSSFSGD
ncbi:hypothetical protein Bca4012_019936 [Brassica carinata]|uniref:Uncharacterized protein n=1 Tax=Brassica carinata TaxID=52824 RepID=A0A8X8BD99_BRACI|nr:hypothetical protein Bca52824_001652 [Brassica carinata]